ncbi:Lin0512 family protein [Hydrogenophaga sp.]|uniref:Lin0512 family protein n=1 Tax=Hydrogenophaga sp. TaxID=1904254 RepID=UPI00273268AA|nr:Lin0512 family protein [Hydrogenophaga sp.]MDP3884319.1 Lin0512 family protein [Hydrogenophaga sp.]
MQLEHVLGNINTIRRSIHTGPPSSVVEQEPPLWHFDAVDARPHLSSRRKGVGGVHTISLNVADAFGFPKEAMIINAEIGVQRPDEVDRQALLNIFPYGQPSVTVVKGGLDIPHRDKEGWSVVANAAVMVSFDMEPAHD